MNDPPERLPGSVPVIVIEVCCDPDSDHDRVLWFADQLQAMVAEGTGKPAAVRSRVTYVASVTGDDRAA